MKAGVSTACLYPRLLEESVYDLAVNGINHIEIFVNTDSELKKLMSAILQILLNVLKYPAVRCTHIHVLWNL